MAGQKGTGSDHVEYTANKDVTGQVVGRMPTFLLGMTEEERELMEKKLVRKIDARLLIMLVVMYILNYLDRNNIASAKLAGLDKDLNLKGNQYQAKMCWLTVLDLRQHPIRWISIDARFAAPFRDII
ncbi:unnamed protein product [Penicillium manginii]